jgi:hypothetical protein
MWDYVKTILDIADLRIFHIIWRVRQQCAKGGCGIDPYIQRTCIKVDWRYEISCEIYNHGEICNITVTSELVMTQLDKIIRTEFLVSAHKMSIYGIQFRYHFK